MTGSTAARTARGPIALTGGSAAVLRPLGAPFRFAAGFWGLRQSVNSATSIRRGWDELHAHGQWENLRRAAGTAPGRHTGRPYTDSDVYKMAEAQAWDAQHTSDVAAARDRIDQVAALVGAAQERTGYLNSWFQCTGTEHFSDLQMGHEMYCAGHLILAAVAAARALESKALLDCATAFADHLVDTFADRPGVCGHPLIESALVELYRQTDRARYVDLARRMLDQRGRGTLGRGWYGADYYQDQTSVRDARELSGHCVRAMYLAAGATDVYLETGEPDLLDALERQWEHTVATKTYLTGGVGCRRKTEAFGAPYELPPDQAFNETCAAVGNVMWSWRMLLATGAGRYADHIERLLYNVLAAAVSLDGGQFAYVNTLHRRGSAMEQGDKAPFRKPWFDCACCPPNLMRTIASLGHLMVTADDSGVQVHQYASGSLVADLGGGDTIILAVRTRYPWHGSIHLDVVGAPEGACTVSLRVPGWCVGASLRVNDAPVDLAIRRGYATLVRRWRQGDQVALDLPVAPRWTLADRRVDAIRGCAAIEAGPVVYCFEDADLASDTCLDDYTVDAAEPLRTVDRPDILGGTMTVECAGYHLLDVPATWPYGSLDPPGPGREVTLTAIPYHRWDNRDRGRMRVWMPVCADSC